MTGAPWSGLESVTSVEFSTTWEREKQMRELVTEACRLVSRDDGVRSVHIVGPGRPTYAALCGYRHEAMAQHVALALDRRGTIAIRPERKGNLI